MSSGILIITLGVIVLTRINSNAATIIGENISTGGSLIIEGNVTVSGEATLATTTISALSQISDNIIYVKSGETIQSTIDALAGGDTDNPYTIIISKGTYAFTDDYTIPAYISLEFNKGAIFNVSDEKTLTINGPLKAGLYQIFSEDSVISFGAAVEEAYTEWWGALPDDSTDGWNAVLAAARALNGRGGGVIRFAAGTYRWGGGQSSFYDNIALVGQSADHTVIDLYDDGTLGTNKAKFSGVINNIRLEKIHFKNDRFAYDRAIRFLDTGPYGGSANYVTIKDNYFTCSTRPFRLAGVTHVRILNNEFFAATVGEPSISVDDGCDDVQIIGNTVESATVSTNLNHCINAQATNLVVSGNHVGGARMGGILIEGYSDAVVSDNIVDFTTVDSSFSQMYGIYIEGGNNVVVSNNTIKGRSGKNYETGIKIDVGRTNTDGARYSIIGNEITDTYYGIWSTCLGDTTHLYPRLTIEGNSIRGGNYGFYISENSSITTAGDNTYITIRNNNFIEFASVGIYAVIDNKLDLFDATNNRFCPADTASHSIKYRYGAGRTVFGNNVSTNTSIPMFSAHWLREMDDADFQNIEFLDIKTVLLPELDLSENDQFLFPLTAKNRLIINATFLYTEASSADTGDYLKFYEYGTSGQGNKLFEYKSESSKNLGYFYTKWYTQMQSTIENSAREGYEYIRGGMTGGKTGDGKIVVILNYIEDPTDYDVNRY